MRDTTSLRGNSDVSKKKKRKPNWKKEGMKSNGLYNTIKKSALSDSPPIGNELREVIRDPMTKYKEQK